MKNNKFITECVPPAIFCSISMFLPIILVGLQAKNIIPNTFAGKLYLLSILLPSILLLILAFFMSKKHSGNTKINYFEAISRAFSISQGSSIGREGKPFGKSWHTSIIGIAILFGGLFSIIIILGFIFGK